MYEKLESILMDFLQYNIIIKINGKLFRKGRFIKFKMHDFFMRLDFIHKDKKRKIELPLPYKILYDKENKSITMSYKLDDMAIEYESILKLYDDVTEKGRLYDALLSIEVEK